MTLLSPVSIGHGCYEAKYHDIGPPLGINIIEKKPKEKTDRAVPGLPDGRRFLPQLGHPRRALRLANSLIAQTRRDRASERRRERETEKEGQFIFRHTAFERNDSSMCLLRAIDARERSNTNAAAFLARHSLAGGLSQSRRHRCRGRASGHSKLGNSNSRRHQHPQHQ